MNLEIALDAGSMESQIICENEKLIFKKSVTSSRESFLKKIEKKYFLNVFNKLPQNFHREIPENGLQSLEKEIFTWYLWRNSGIPTLDFEEFSDDSIKWKYLENSMSLKQYFDSNNSIKTFEKFTDLYTQIRKKAFRYKDSNYFHSDPHLGNFLLNSNDEIIPIDSGCLLNKNLSLSELDFHLLKQTLFSISSIKTKKEVKNEYVSIFCKNLENKQKEQLLNWNYSVSPGVLIYFSLRENFIKLFLNKTRQSLLEEHFSFVNYFNSDVKKILEK